jgi:hypothetical protein
MAVPPTSVATKDRKTVLIGHLLWLWRIDQFVHRSINAIIEKLSYRWYPNQAGDSIQVFQIELFDNHLKYCVQASKTSQNGREDYVH